MSPASKRPHRAVSISTSASSDEAEEPARTKRKTAQEWPASPVAMDAAREFLRECAKSSTRTLLVPDKDADGLSAGVILHRTLVALGHDASKITVHLLAKGSNPHAGAERERMAAYDADYAIFVDHGSRGGPELVPPGAKGRVRTLLVDHHLSDEFPEGAMVLSACKNPPIATSATLAYTLCEPLHASIPESCDYLCAMGTHGDLGTSFKWEPPFPDMKQCFKRYTKKAVNDAVSLVNAPRRTATFDVISAWEALLSSGLPSSILKHPRLLAAREEVNAEVERCTHVRPIFSGDGRIAMLKMSSAAQVHPVIATRWAGHLKSSKLEIVMAANDGYLPGMVNFSCRVARCAMTRSSGATKSSKTAKAAIGTKERAQVFDAFKRPTPGAGRKTETKTTTAAAASSSPGEQGVSALTTDPEDGGISIPAILIDYASREPGLREEMGQDFARGHAQASGGIVTKEAFERLWKVMSEAVDLEAQAAKDGKQGKAKARIATLEGWVKKL